MADRLNLLTAERTLSNTFIKRKGLLKALKSILGLLYRWMALNSVKFCKLLSRNEIMQGKKTKRRMHYGINKCTTMLHAETASSPRLSYLFQWCFVLYKEGNMRGNIMNTFSLIKLRMYSLFQKYRARSATCKYMHNNFLHGVF